MILQDALGGAEGRRLHTRSLRTGWRGEVRLRAAFAAHHKTQFGLLQPRRYYWGSLTSLVYVTPARFDTLLPS